MARWSHWKHKSNSLIMNSHANWKLLGVHSNYLE
jgi:hypothetical protein